MLVAATVTVSLCTEILQNEPSGALDLTVPHVFRLEHSATRDAGLLAENKECW